MYIIIDQFATTLTYLGFNKPNSLSTWAAFPDYTVSGVMLQDSLGSKLAQLESFSRNISSLF